MVNVPFVVLPMASTRIKDCIWVMTEPVCFSLPRNKISQDHVDSEQPMKPVSFLGGTGSRFPGCGLISSGPSVLTVVGGWQAGVKAPAAAQTPASLGTRQEGSIPASAIFQITSKKRDKRCNTGKEKTKLSVVTDTIV